MTVRTISGAALPAFPLAAIVYGRFVPSRYFWRAPFDTQTQYSLDVRVNGRALGPREIAARDGRPQKGTDRAEIPMRYRAEIPMRYRARGKEERRWRWPR